MDYFEVFGLPRKLGIDLKDLERKFHQLSRQYHPDYFATAAPQEKEKALRMTSLVNDAYRTLRHPIQRLEHLLSLEGFRADGSKVPQSLLMEVFEINEQLEEVKGGSATPDQLQEVRTLIHEKRVRFATELEAASTEWDQLVTQGAAEDICKRQLSKLTEILSESSYVRNLEEELDRLTASDGKRRE